jgi:chemotaxis protein MotB
MKMSQGKSGRNLGRAGAGAVVGILAVAGMGLGGCSGSNSALLEANRALQDRNTALTQQNDSLSTQNQQLQNALSERDAALNEARTSISNMGNSDAAARLAELEARMKNQKFGDINIALDASTDAALRELANQHPDLLEYDAARGLLRFKSDLTFDSGSDQVKAGAKSSLQAFANILNGAAAQYDVRIIGHTDAQRLSAPTAARHTSNLRLSCDRAISVRGELVGYGVNRDRFEVGGRGEFDPLVPNTSSGNTPQNRRVDVYLVKPVGSRIPVTPTPEGTLPPRGSRAATTPSRPSTPPSRPASTSEDVMK